MTSQEYDAVSNPKHYHRDGVDFECVELSTCFPHPMASAIEYVFRYKEKNGVQDLEKALWWFSYAIMHWETQLVIIPKGSPAFSMLRKLEHTTDGAERDFWKALVGYSMASSSGVCRGIATQAIFALGKLIEDERDKDTSNE